MKIKNFRYLVGEGIKGAWANRLMTLASMGVLVACMVILGLAFLISQNVSKAIGVLEKQNVVIVYMKDQTWALFSDNAEELTGGKKENLTDDMYDIHNEQEAQEFCDKIAELDNVDSVVYISGNEGLSSLKDKMSEGQQKAFESLDVEGGNPLPGAAQVTMKDMSKFKETVEQIRQIKGVESIYEEGELADNIYSALPTQPIRYYAVSCWTIR